MSWPPSATPDPASAGRSGSDAPTRVPGELAPASGSSAAARTLAPADAPTLEGYTLIEEIHRGGQGVVYRATQLGTKREVALKVLLEGPYAGEGARRRFEREIELAASLRHPNVVTILDSGLNHGRYYFAMEFIRGQRLDHYVAARGLSRDEKLALFEKVCAAVNFAHQRGVIHRDLKPPNILVDEDGEPHVLDFGLAKPLSSVAMGESTVQVLSMSGQLIGTVAYMSPEQAAGAHDVDVRTDIYAIGVMLYEAVTGQKPYSVDGPLGEILRRIAHDDPTDPRTAAARSPARPHVDDDIATILLKSLEKDPARRYQTAGDLGRDLKHYRSGEPIEARRASGLYMLRKALLRYRVQAVAAGLVLVMLIGFLITFASLFAAEREARRRADLQTDETKRAVERQESALKEAHERTLEARRAEQQLRLALSRERIQRGDLALQRGDLLEAADRYWEAAETASGPAQRWALRRCFQQAASGAGRLLTLGATGPTAVSRGGAIAAITPGADSIALYRMADGALLAWRPIPAAPISVSVDDDGAAAALGTDWLRVWAPGAALPSIAAHFSEAPEYGEVHVIDGGAAALAISDDLVEHFAGVTGQERRTARFNGRRRGQAQFDPATRTLAAPTLAGVELVRVGEDLVVEIGWQNPSPAQLAVAIDPRGALAAVSDAIYVRRLRADAAAGAAWSRLASTAGVWSLFAYDSEGERGVLAGVDGRIATMASAEVRPPRKAPLERVSGVALTAGGEGYVAISERGAVLNAEITQTFAEKRTLLNEAAAAWAVSADASTALLAGERNRVVLCSPRTSPSVTTLLRPRLVGPIAGFSGAADAALALDAEGRRALVRDVDTLRFVEIGPRLEAIVRRTPASVRLPTLGDVALSDDGEWTAVVAASLLREQQRITLQRWPRGGRPRRGGVRDEAYIADFVGSTIRSIAFLPGDGGLLATRSNGEIVLLEIPSEAADAPRELIPRLWASIDAAPTALARNRTGELLALACNDDAIRVFAAPSRELKFRIDQAPGVVAMSFNPRDDVLLARDADGRVRLYEMLTGEAIASWPQGAGSMAAWFAEGDALMVSADDAVYQTRFDDADAVVDANRTYLRQRQASRRLLNGELESAWVMAETLTGTDALAGRAARGDVLAAALRRARYDMPAAWLEGFVADISASERLRLAHAAYEGERFDTALELFGPLLGDASERFDALSLLRVAACNYLVGQHDAALETLTALAARADLDPRLAPLASLQRVAALVMSGRAAEARQAVGSVGDPDAWGRTADPVAVTATRITARTLASIDEESLALRALDELLTRLDARALLYKDDLRFFLGELARRRGDLDEARVQYQRCLDLAQDEWPSNWARRRLAELRGPDLGSS